jgi:hypothetical protein
MGLYVAWALLARQHWRGLGGADLRGDLMCMTAAACYGLGQVTWLGSRLLTGSREVR